MKITIKIILLLLITGIFETYSSHAFSGDDAACDADGGAMNTFITQIAQCLSTNHNLTQHMLMLNERLHHLQLQLEETQRKVAQLEQLPPPTSNYQTDATRDIVIQRRQDGSVDFYRTWSEYQQGFGDVRGEFFIGLDMLHKLTNSRPYALLIVLEDWEHERRYETYNRFVVGSEAEKYELKSLGNYTGTAGDSLTYHLGQKFSTKDQENDKNDNEHCAVWYTGAWWYNACHHCNLNGRYLKGTISSEEIAQGIHWLKFRGQQYSLKFVEMSLQPLPL